MYTNEELVLVSWCKNVASSLMVCSISLFCLLLFFLLLSFLLLPAASLLSLSMLSFEFGPLSTTATHLFLWHKKTDGEKRWINGPMPDLEELTKFCNVKLKQTLLYLDKMKANKEPDPQTNWVLEPLKYNFMINSC